MHSIIHIDYCPGGGTVYTAVLEAVPERVASSNLALGTIHKKIQMDTLLFSVNEYDRDGDLVEKCVVLHIGTTMLKFRDVAQMEKFAQDILGMLPEIQESVYR